MSTANHLAPNSPHDQAAVAVVVRTVKRPLFLRRALSSIGEQSLQDYVCVVVCDGGDFPAVASECARSPIDPSRLIVIDNKTSRGMEAASNLGIARVTSEFIAIHDDDDSWEPDFLRRTVEYLRQPSAQRYGGVATWSTYVSELSTPEGPAIKSRRPFRTDRVVHFIEMARNNLFPPISFLFRRKVYERIGGYNEALPVLGDWDFNLRFLLEADIAVIREPLANYHHRDLQPDPAFGNSVIEDRDRHLEFEAVIRNALLRSTLANSALVGVILALATPQGARVSRGADEEETLGPKGVNAILRAVAAPESECLRRRLNDPWYLRAYPDLARAGVDTYVHWMKSGVKEGRLPAPDLVELAEELLVEREAALRAVIEAKERELCRVKEQLLEQSDASEPSTKHALRRDRDI
jgi:glycosyltransferase involved in cell wall biosynthesis